jgi:hypothetical protein
MKHSHRGDKLVAAVDAASGLLRDARRAHGDDVRDGHGDRDKSGIG